MKDEARDFIVIETLRAAARIRRDRLAREAGILWLRFLIIHQDPNKARRREIEQLKAALDHLLPAAMERSAA